MGFGVSFLLFRMWRLWRGFRDARDNSRVGNAAFWSVFFLGGAVCRLVCSWLFLFFPFFLFLLSFFSSSLFVERLLSGVRFVHVL